jgi:serine/threonine-protein kinase
MHVVAHAHAEMLDGFELRRELGRGGSGIVYEAVRDGASVALKIQRELDERERERFVREAQLMRRVSHPALVKLLGSGVSGDGRAYLVMELLHGETLAERLRRGPMPVDEAVRMFTPLASAVQTLHDERLVHRDIKPENVMLAKNADGTLRPVLLDFGIVREVEASASTTTAAGFVRGSRAYMAPERFFGQGASVASDVYELGVTLYMMLSGRLPWGEEDAAGSRLDPEALPQPSGRALSRVVMRSISTRPEQRHQTAGAFRDAVIDASQAKSVPDMGRTTDAEPVLPRTTDVEVIIPRPPHSDTDAPASITVESPLSEPTSTGTRRVEKKSRAAWVAIAACTIALVAGGIALTKVKTGETQGQTQPQMQTQTQTPTTSTIETANANATPTPIATSTSTSTATATATATATSTSTPTPTATSTSNTTRPPRAKPSASAPPPASSKPAASAAPPPSADVYYMDRR